MSFVFSLTSNDKLLGQDFCGTRCCGRISSIDFSEHGASETFQVHPQEEKVTTLYLGGFGFLILTLHPLREINHSDFL